MPLQFTKNQILVLKEFFNNTHKSYYLRELARLLKKEPGVFQRDINKLEKDGILESYYQGKNRFFELNKKHAFFEELKSIISKTVGIEAVIKKMIKGIKGVEEAFIYGSTAQNSENLMSDIDIFVIGDVNEDKLIDAISKLEKQIGREINYTLMTKEEFNQKKEAKNSFINNVFNKKTIKLL
jgi:predicted nucleotidyltransferase